MIKHVDLKEFRERLQTLETIENARPFLCDGSPLTAQVFIVGFNPATSLKHSFWSYWSDDHGFDRSQFMKDYLFWRRMKGARPRIQAIVDQFPNGTCLETNICSMPTARAAQLTKEDRRTAAFEFLLESVKPEIVFLHSNEPIRFLHHRTGVEAMTVEPQQAVWKGQAMLLSGKPGPLWRLSLDKARRIGIHLQHSAGILATACNFIQGPC